MEKIQYIPGWAKGAIIYHIYPLGFFNAPKYGRDEQAIIPRLEQIRDFYDHFSTLGINVIQFGPIFESERHGYDTIDYMTIDHRLRSNSSHKSIWSAFNDHNLYELKAALERSFHRCLKLNHFTLQKDQAPVGLTCNGM